MKTMTCRQLGGAGELAFHANTFDEMAAQSKQHGMEMWKIKDAPHMEAMQAMASIMQSMTELNKWMEEKRIVFNSLPDDGN